MLEKQKFYSTMTPINNFQSLNYFSGMQARLMLAALDWNSRIHTRALSKDNVPKHHQIWSKRRKVWVIRAAYKNTSAQHIPQLIGRVLEVHSTKTELPEMHVPADLPAHVSAKEKPEKGPAEQQNRV